MNEFLKNNWNSTVRGNDIVYFLGDWSFGRGSRPASYWMRQLKGHIVSVRGCHDNDVDSKGFEKTKVLHTREYDFLLVHDPEDRQPGWQGWTIHAHVHNNNMQKYPFINGEQKTINVSSELVGYRPVSLDYLLSLDLDAIRWMTTINDQPERSVLVRLKPNRN
jgi:calcineurin-like phosphoesterase family protein